jgi:hypothetical protein
VTAPQPGEIEVEDQLERRIRKPVDLLRCVLSCFGIVALAVAGIGASATTSGVQTDLVGASHRLPHALVVVAGPVALLALLILPVAMAVQLLVRRQFRRLGEAVATGVLAAAVTAVVNDLLHGLPPADSTTRSSWPVRAPATPRRSILTWRPWSPTPPWSAWLACRTGGTPCGRRSPCMRSCRWERCIPPS